MVGRGGVRYAHGAVLRGIQCLKRVKADNADPCLAVLASWIICLKVWIVDLDTIIMEPRQRLEEFVDNRYDVVAANGAHRRVCMAVDLGFEPP